MGDLLLYVANSAPFFMSHRLPLARAARTLGLEVQIAAPEAEDLSPLRREGFVVHPYPYVRGGLNPIQGTRTLEALIRLYRASRPTLVHHVTLKPILLGSIAARLASVPAVVNALYGLGHLFVEGDWYRGAIRQGLKAVGRITLRHPNSRFLFQNEDDRDVFVRAGMAKAVDSVVIRGSGVDVSVFKVTPEPDGSPVVVLSARMIWHKGIGVFVDAARRLRQSGSPARFVLVGEPDTANPECVGPGQLLEWQREGVIEWWGHRTDMPSVLGGCHVVTLPTMYREGVPKILIEAAACGRPLVTTDMPGCRDIVRDGFNGMLVPPGDPAALAAALEKLLADPALRVLYGQRGRALVEREFAIEHVIEQTLGVYRELLAQLPEASS